MYKLNKDPHTGLIEMVLFIGNGYQLSIPFDPANTDYQDFKTNVLVGAELQDADGNVMTDASAYIATLP